MAGAFRGDLMVEYQIIGSHSGKEYQVGADRSARKALGFYNAAKISLPVTAVWIVANGFNIGVDELRKRAFLEE